MWKRNISACLLIGLVAACALAGAANGEESPTPTTQPTTRGAWPFDLTILRPSVTRARASDRDRHRFIVEARGDGQFRDPPFDDALWTREQTLSTLLKDRSEAAKKGESSRLIVIVYGKEAMQRSGPDFIETSRLDDGHTLLILCNPTYHFGTARVLFVVDGEIRAEQAVPLD